MTAAYCREEKKSLLTRLKKIEGQVQGLQRMLEEDKDCVDVLIQIAAVRAALDKVGIILFENHTRKCLVKALEEGRQEEMVDELIEVLRKFMK
ncbi:MAG TPA: metal-sensitive transcriptional regulator [Clostridia bacterium]|nr:metal-sensitive transcriptional regulator [Clostridia bacterium]